MPARSYKTRQREAVLNCVLESAGDHVTARQVTELLNKKGEKVGLTTVYRCLDRLVDEGVLLRFFAAEGESACFRLAKCGSDSCFHMKCEECGKLFHTECEYINDVAEHINEEHGFTVNPYKTVFYGTCDECKSRHRDK